MSSSNSMLPPLNGDGRLPLGRWTTDPDAVYATYVEHDGGVRPLIWDQWREATNALREIVGSIPACWLSGSFFTTKERPGDLDCVYLLREEHVAHAMSAATDDEARVYDAIVNNRLPADFKLDTFGLTWSPVTGPGPQSQEQASYLYFRGYWDDLWSRARSDDKSVECLPRRGYLEVILDGYN